MQSAMYVYKYFFHIIFLSCTILMRNEKTRERNLKGRSLAAVLQEKISSNDLDSHAFSQAGGRLPLHCMYLKRHHDVIPSPHSLFPRQTRLPPPCALAFKALNIFHPFNSHEKSPLSSKQIPPRIFVSHGNISKKVVKLQFRPFQSNNSIGSLPDRPETKTKTNPG